MSLTRLNNKPKNENAPKFLFLLPLIALCAGVGIGAALSGGEDVQKFTQNITNEVDISQILNIVVESGVTITQTAQGINSFQLITGPGPCCIGGSLKTYKDGSMECNPNPNANITIDQMTRANFEIITSSSSDFSNATMNEIITQVQNEMNGQLEDLSTEIGEFMDLFSDQVNQELEQNIQNTFKRHFESNIKVSNLINIQSNILLINESKIVCNNACIPSITNKQNIVLDMTVRAALNSTFENFLSEAVVLDLISKAQGTITKQVDPSFDFRWLGAIAVVGLIAIIVVGVIVYKKYFASGTGARKVNNQLPRNIQQPQPQNNLQKPGMQQMLPQKQVLPPIPKSTIEPSKLEQVVKTGADIAKGAGKVMNAINGNNASSGIGGIAGKKF